MSEDTVWQTVSVYSAAAIGVLHIFSLAVAAINRDSRLYGNINSISRNDIVEGEFHHHEMFVVRQTKKYFIFRFQLSRPLHFRESNGEEGEAFQISQSSSPSSSSAAFSLCTNFFEIRLSQKLPVILKWEKS